MPTQEQINAAQLELDIAADNEIKARDRLEKYEKIFTAITEMPKEKRRQLDATTIQNAINDYKATKQALNENIWRQATAETTLKKYQDTIAQQQPIQQQAAIYRQWGQRRRVTIPNNWYNINNDQQPVLTNEELARKYFWDNWYYVVNTYPNQTWYKSNTSDSFIDPNWWVAFWPAYKYTPRNSAWSTYNDYVNAWAEWGTKWMTDYLRTLPNPYTHTKYANSLYNDMIKSWATRAQANDFIKNWVNAHTP